MQSSLFWNFTNGREMRATRRVSTTLRINFCCSCSQVKNTELYSKLWVTSVKISANFKSSTSSKTFGTANIRRCWSLRSSSRALIWCRTCSIDWWWDCNRRSQLIGSCARISPSNSSKTWNHRHLSTLSRCSRPKKFHRTSSSSRFRSTSFRMSMSVLWFNKTVWRFESCQFICCTWWWSDVANFWMRSGKLTTWRTLRSIESSSTLSITFSRSIQTSTLFWTRCTGASACQRRRSRKSRISLWNLNWNTLWRSCCSSSKTFLRLLKKFRQSLITSKFCDRSMSTNCQVPKMSTKMKIWKLRWKLWKLFCFSSQAFSLWSRKCSNASFWCSFKFIAAVRVPSLEAKPRFCSRKYWKTRKFYLPKSQLRSAFGWKPSGAWSEEFWRSRLWRLSKFCAQSNHRTAKASSGQQLKSW